MFRLFFRTGKKAGTSSKKRDLKKRDRARYVKERERARNADSTVRVRLAETPETHPEILYYLAQDEDPSVRRAVAGNASTPAHASPLLAKDRDIDVRLILAGRLVNLLPRISGDQHSQLYAFTVQALGALAHDEVLKVRKALAVTLRDHAHAPPKVVGHLARDIEREVSEPILKFCINLTDDDLLDILSHHPEPWVISAIAGRETVSPPVVDMIVDSEDEEANTILINNAGAQYSESALRKIIDRARQMPDWHRPLALRKELSFSMAQHLAGFVDESVKKILSTRKDLDKETRAEVTKIVRRRLDFAEDRKESETPEQRVLRLAREGRLDDAAISDALAWQDTEFVVQALGIMAQIPPPLVEKIVATRTAKPVVSLAWKAGLPMRLAVELQKQLAHVQPRDLIYAKDGVEYPLLPEDMVWQLEFFGVGAHIH